MKFLQLKNNRLKLLGLTIFKVIHKNNKIVIKVLGIPIWISENKILKLDNIIKTNTNLDTRAIDYKIFKLFSGIKQENNSTEDFVLNSKRIAYLATILYDMGGHTKNIKNMVKSLNDCYEQKLFLTNFFSITKKRAPNAIEFISKLASIECIDNLSFNIPNLVVSISSKIIAFSPKVLLVYIHPNDLLGAAILSFLKKNTKIKIIYSNHASHVPCIGMSFADMIWEGTLTTKKITEEKRHLSNSQVVGIQSLEKEDTVYFSKEELQQFKLKIGIPQNSMVSMSGGAAYKFFDENQDSEYLNMIKRILKKEKNLTHVIISEFSNTQNEIFNKIFKDSPNEKKRIIFIPYQADFDEYFQCADIFIDSFPMSSALTQIDLMRNKVVSIVKINRDSPELSFHEYQMPNYPYMFDSVEGMENAIYELLHDKHKRDDIVAKNYKFWLETYEGSVAIKRKMKIIEEF